MKEDSSSLYQFFPVADLSEITNQKNVKEIYQSSIVIRDEMSAAIKQGIEKTGLNPTKLVKEVSKKVAPKSYITKSIDKVELDGNILRIQTKLTKSSFAFANWINDVSSEIKKMIGQDSIQLVLRLKK